ncbi:Anaerobic C4-dicarboxylate transporter DcuB [Serratia fonticola]|uniref:Anaerobic C4-dicarboxylate transporter DcuB n=1 Tax=Serratia fonticola TaxID=47917 RepID=A0A4U9VLX7_SERFO|nr:Anaerobic C4-dicarboxylate transporter DcuB [Serratia fonticola]
MAVVSLVSIIAAGHGIGKAYSLLEILAVSIPASLVGVLMAALWSLRRGKDLDKDADFQARIQDPEQRAYIYGGTETLLNQTFPKQAYWSTLIFFGAIAIVVMLGALPIWRPSFADAKGVLKPLSMNLVSPDDDADRRCGES